MTAQLLVIKSEKQLADARSDYREGVIAGLTLDKEYLQTQIEIYQIRLGLIIPPAGAASPIEHKPIRKSREPFEALSSRVAKAQADKMEEYWRKRADEVDIAGVTSSEEVKVPVSNDTGE